MTNGSHSEADDGDDRAATNGASTYELHDGVEPSVRIVEAVADATSRDATTLPPLQNAVDVDAINRVLADGSGDTSVHVTLEYAGRVVEVDADGAITVEA